MYSSIKLFYCFKYCTDIQLSIIVSSQRILTNISSMSMTQQQTDKTFTFLLRLVYHKSIEQKLDTFTITLRKALTIVII